ncbi:hypothetical protein KVT40_001748 [Elsinoe batatas]|uniref:La domain-containing protein n=1 Tax=Elsinoe batatas TaxID=2601811 RepID=A0A8K0L7X3_9PEZI|nr:hypothetical protein KVT40_001748 [Elsinoe batatas]
MSEVEKAPVAAEEQVQSNGTESKPADENGVKTTEKKVNTTTDSEVKQTVETAEPEKNGNAETEDKENVQNGETKSEGKTGGRERDEIDEKIDRYARETKRPFQRKPKQIRSNFENLPETDDADEIRRQVEFYFSDANLHQDAFLLRETGGSKNRPFPLKQLHTFKRMRRFQPFSAVLAAVKDSKVLQVNDHDEITRKTPMSGDYDEEDTRQNKRIYEEKSMARTVYAKGFGEETETTQTDIEEFFAPYGDVSAVRLRRWSAQGEFKGSVLVEFADEETAKSFLDLDPKPKWQGKHELEFRTKKDWSEEKKKWEADHPRRDNDRYQNKGKKFDRRDNRRDDRGGRYENRGYKGRGGGRRDRSRDRSSDRSRSRSRSPRRRGDDEDWRDRRDRERGDRRDRGGRRDNNKGRRGDDRRSKRDRDDDREDREEKQDKRERTPESGDEVSKLASKKRSRDDADGGAEPEAKKVKEDESEVKTEKAAEEVSTAA